MRRLVAALSSTRSAGSGSLRSNAPGAGTFAVQAYAMIWSASPKFARLELMPPERIA